VLDELPPGRRPPVTAIARGEEQRQAAYRRLRASLAEGEGRQAFVVCPVREKGTRPGAVTATARFAELRRTLAADGLRVGLLHGALEAAAKESVLGAFASGAIQVLVATTVVELGIDVPGATVMLVEDAERFGLAQLHQLRGRVGRGRFPGLCLLCTGDGAAGEGDDSDGDGDGARGRDDREAGAAARLRLEQLAATSDGFRIAEADLAQRGEGDLHGVRQAGVPPLRFAGRGADLPAYLRLVELARAEAQRIAAADPELARPEHRALGAAVAARWADGGVFAEEAG